MGTLRESPRVFIKIKSQRPPGVQINMCVSAEPDFQQHSAGWVRVTPWHFPRIMSDARNTSGKIRL